MSSGENPFLEPVGDPFDEFFREALHRTTPSPEPPPRVWERIQSQVTAGPAPTSHQPPRERLSRLFAPFVQGLAAAIIFVLVGVSLGTTRWEFSRKDAPPPPRAIPAAVEPHAEPIQVAAVQRLGRFGAVDDATDYGLRQSQQPKLVSQVARATRLRVTSDDLDMDLVRNRLYVPESSGP